MTAKIVLITGANAGLGYEAVKVLLQSDTIYHILLSGRDLSKAQQASLAVLEEVPGTKSTVEAIQIDVESDDSILAAVAAVSKKQDQIDVLINNAGASYDSQGHDGRMTARQAWSRTWDVNVASAHLVTTAFLPLLLNSQRDPRLLFVTSGLASFHDTNDPKFLFKRIPPAGLPKPPAALAYKTSKVALNMLMMEWSRMLTEDKVKVFAVAPGLLATSLGGDPEMLKKLGGQPPSVGGLSLRKVVEGEFDEYAGQIVPNYNSSVQPW